MSLVYEKNLECETLFLELLFYMITMLAWARISMETLLRMKERCRIYDKVLTCKLYGVESPKQAHNV